MSDQITLIVPVQKMPTPANTPKYSYSIFRSNTICPDGVISISQSGIEFDSLSGRVFSVTLEDLWKAYRSALHAPKLDGRIA